MSEERTRVEIKLDDGNTFRHTEYGMYDKVLLNITRDIRDDGYLVFFDRYEFHDCQFRTRGEHIYARLFSEGL